MTNFLHYEFDLSANDPVEVTLDKQANVRLLDDTNYLLYKSSGLDRVSGGVR